MANKHEEWSEIKDATEETQKICDEVKDQVEEKTKKKYEEYTAVKYTEWIKPGVGAGVEYLIKVHVGGVNYIHLCVSQVVYIIAIQLRGAQQDNTKDSPLVPFLNE